MAVQYQWICTFDHGHGKDRERCSQTSEWCESLTDCEASAAHHAARHNRFLPVQQQQACIQVRMRKSPKTQPHHYQRVFTP